MTELRRSTVYDYSDLRLHPDGRRVHQMDKNLRQKASQIAVQAARSNWIAWDAAGSATVPKHRSTNQDAAMDVGGDQNEDGNEFEEADSETSVNPSKRRRPDHRKANFRRKFLKNEDYLVEEASTSIPINKAASEFEHPFLPNPPPDLLKCIHRFASEFYTERGQLLNSSKLYRQERKARKEKRRARIRKQAVEDNRDSSSSSPSSYDSSQGEDEDVRETDGTRRGSKGKQSKRRLIGDLYTDMYKVFDGSAMMALGMLVQEHVAHFLTPRIPETWESEVRSTYTGPWGDSQPHSHKQGHSGEGQIAQSVTIPNVNESGLHSFIDIHRDVEIEDEEDEASRTSELDGSSPDLDSDDDSSHPGDTKHSSSEDSETESW